MYTSRSIYHPNNLATKPYTSKTYIQDTHRL